MEYYKQIAKARRALKENPSIRVVCITQEGIFKIYYGEKLPFPDHRNYFPVSRFDFEDKDIKTLSLLAKEKIERGENYVC